jgi:lycopene beta-cyclase
MAKPKPLIIVGGGLAGSLAALALAERRTEVPLLLVEAGSSFGGNHVWSYFDGDIRGDGLPLVEALQPVRWPSHEVRFPGRQRTLGLGYNSIHSDKLHALVRRNLDPSQFRLDASVSRIEPEAVTLEGGEQIAGSAVIDARGPDGAMPGLELAWQKFVGLEYDAPAHGLAAPVIMDATVDQAQGYRFLYSLPFDTRRLLVEDTYYTEGPELDVEALRARIAAYCTVRGWRGMPVREEVGILPILLGGDPQAFWPPSDPIARLGLKGGFFHPTTGYSLPLAAANAAALTSLPDLGSAAIAEWTRARFLDHWRHGGFYRLLNRMLFRAAAPKERVKIFAHFYRLDEELVGRFYAGRLTALDKLRILSGKPPVPVLKALKAMAA